MNIFNVNSPFAARVQTVQTIDQAYEAARAASMDRVSPRLWRFGLLALFLTLVLGAGAALALANGLADPPYAPNLLFETASLDGLSPAGTLDTIALYPISETFTIPFTLETEASSGGGAWGIWLRADGADRVLLVDNRGYMLTSLHSSEPEWREFMHIRAPRNQVYLHVENEQAVFRINRELVTAFPVDRLQAVGVALQGDPRLTWHSINLWGTLTDDKICAIFHGRR